MDPRFGFHAKPPLLQYTCTELSITHRSLRLCTGITSPLGNLMEKWGTFFFSLQFRPKSWHVPLSCTHHDGFFIEQFQVSDAGLAFVWHRHQWKVSMETFPSCQTNQNDPVGRYDPNLRLTLGLPDHDKLYGGCRKCQESAGYIRRVIV